MTTDSPTVSFVAKSLPPLQTKFEVSLIKGAMTDECLFEIRKYLITASRDIVTSVLWSKAQSNITPVWKDNRGIYTKRLANFFWKELRWDVPSNVLSEIGNIASKHANVETDQYMFEISNIDWSPGDFADQGSCMFNSRLPGLRSINKYGAAIKVYAADGKKKAGRCFISKLDDKSIIMSGTKTTIKVPDEAFAIWNGYGVPLLRIARLLATHAGLSYKQINLTNGKDGTSGQVWINGGVGFIIAHSELCMKTTAVVLNIPILQASRACKNCGNKNFEEDVDDCGCRHCGRMCPICGKYATDMQLTATLKAGEEVYQHTGIARKKTKILADLNFYICNTCAGKIGYVKCAYCGRLHQKKDIDPETNACSACKRLYVVTCTTCHKRIPIFGSFVAFTSKGREFYCQSCAPKTSAKVTPI